MKNKKTKKLLIILLILLLLIGLIIFLICKIPAGNTVSDLYTNSELAQKLDENQTNEEKDEDIYISPNITLPGFTDLTIKAHEKNVHLSTSFYNPISNIYYKCPKCNKLLKDLYCTKCDKTYSTDEARKGEYYLKFELYLADTNELIYASDLVCPGFYIDDITLAHELDVGDFNATVNLIPYEDDMTTPCNMGLLHITLHVTDTI